MNNKKRESNSRLYATHMVLLFAKGVVQLSLAAGQNRIVFLVGAGLVGYRAARFAGALAGSLAFTAAAVNQRLFQAVGRNGFDMVHGNPPPFGW
jgi:hypothetical protein